MVLTIFSANDLILESVSYEDFVDIKKRLDATATLALLVGDLSRGAAALPTLVELKSNLICIINFISTSINAGQTEEAETAYETQNTDQAGSRTAGRPILNVTKDQLEHL